MFHGLSLLADAQAASDTLKAGISPVFSGMLTIAAVLCVLFVVFGSYYYMTSGSNPEKLERAKKTLRNAFIGFVVILSAGILVAIMQNAYSQKAVQPTSIAQTQIQETKNDCPLCEIINQSVTGFINGIVQSIGKPIVDALKQFTTATPLMAQNGSVFNLWVVMVAIADVLFLLVIGLIGFRVMSASVVGFEDIDIRSLIPQIILVFIIANLSIFAIDAIITVSNAMIQALMLGMSNDIIWTALGGLIATAASVNIGILLFIAIALILAVMLLIYYLKRLIVLYIGAVLSPLIVLLWLLPSFRDFAISSAKMYITTIFVLFVQVVVLMLAVSLFSGLIQGEGNPFMTALLAIATLSVLLSTNRTMNQLTMMSAGSQGIRKLGNTFVRGVSYIASSAKQAPTKPSVSVSRISETSTSSARPIASKAPVLATGETRQVLPRKSTNTVTARKGSPREVVVAGGTNKSTANPTKASPRKSRTSKGGK